MSTPYGSSVILRRLAAEGGRALSPTLRVVDPEGRILTKDPSSRMAYIVHCGIRGFLRSSALTFGPPQDDRIRNLAQDDGVCIKSVRDDNFGELPFTAFF